MKWVFKGNNRHVCYCLFRALYYVLCVADATVDIYSEGTSCHPTLVPVVARFLESSVPEPNMGSSDGEGTEHCMFRGSTHIRREVFLYGGLDFFCCLNSIIGLAFVISRISFWSAKKKRKEINLPQSGFLQDRYLHPSHKGLWRWRPWMVWWTYRHPAPSGAILAASSRFEMTLSPAMSSHFCILVGKKEDAGKINLLLGTLSDPLATT